MSWQCNSCGWWIDNLRGNCLNCGTESTNEAHYSEFTDEEDDELEPNDPFFE